MSEKMNSNNWISERAQKLTSSVTLALSAMAKEYKSQGKPVVSLTVGEPDWTTPEFAKNEAIMAIQENKSKYTPASGTPQLKGAIAEYTNKYLKTNYSPAQVVVASGAKSSLNSFFQAVCNPGDHVVMQAPYWVSYKEIIELSGAKLTVVDTSFEQSYKVTAAQLKSLSVQPKVFLFNSPSNPTGAVYTKEELLELAEVFKTWKGTLILCDDIYNLIQFDKDLQVAPHLLNVCPELTDQIVSISGVSKTFSMTGWRIGWTVGPQEVISAMNKYQSQAMGCPSSISQEAALGALKGLDDNYVKDIKSNVEGKLNWAYEKFSSLTGWKVFKPQGAFYLWCDLSVFLNTKGYTDVDFCKKLAEEKFVFAVPGEPFGAKNHIRMSVATDQKTLEEAFQRIADFCS